MSQPEPPLFSPGDIVRLKTGKSPQRVVRTRWDQYRKIQQVIAYYLSSESEIRRYQQISGSQEIPHAFLRHPRDQHDFVLWEPETEDQPKEKMMTDLYQVRMQDDNETPRFGTKLTENSQGQYVLEMKGEGGKVEAFNPTDLELVVPYTVQLVCVPPNDSGMHIQCEAGKLEKGDLLILESNGKMFRVAAVDTKNRCPKTGSMTFFKLSGENVTIGNDN